MRDLVAYRQSMTLSTKQWNPPYRKDGNNWVRVENVKPLLDRHDKSFRSAIIRLKSQMEKRRYNNLPIWKCRMTSKKVGRYWVYYLTCKRIRQILV